MLDFLLAKYPKFLNKFREYSREDDIFCQAVDDYIQKKEIEMHPLSEKIQTTYNTSTTYNGNDFDITFSDASNFILAKNKTIEDDRTNQAHIFIFNKVGRTKMNCHIRDYKENPFPIDFLPTGIGLVEHFFNEEEDLIIYELKFGTWEQSDAENKTSLNSILNLFPAVLKEDAPSIEIKFVQDKNNTTIDIQFNSGESKADNFYINFRIDEEIPNLLISTEIDPKQLNNHVVKYLNNIILSLVKDSISNWLSQSIDLNTLLQKDYRYGININYKSPFLAPQEVYPNLDEVKNHGAINYPTETPPILIQAKIHPKLEELDEIEKCAEGESRLRSNPNQKIKNPEAKNVEIKSWITEKKFFR